MYEKAFILIDGNNFYHRLHELNLPALLNFDYKTFGDFLSINNDLVRAKYYIGIVRLKKDNAKIEMLVQNQQRLLAKLANSGWDIGRGYLLEWDGKYHEKGVDVQIAADLLIGAYEDLYDTAVLVSSDTDLIPAIKKAREKGKKVKYVGFVHKTSFALKANADFYQLLNKEDIKKFL